MKLMYYESIYCNRYDTWDYASKSVNNLLSVMLPISPFFSEVKETGSLKSAEDVAKKIVKGVLTS